ncbi:MAG: amino acid adenylation domain-containing protein, partial [Acidimicrobiia bacterium]|nr:amino acid adenylation domain-containing protein [Acidimicrobiia bacterium]
LRAVRRTVLESFDHREVPFEHVVRAVAPARFADRSPLFQVLYQYGVSAFSAAPEFSGIDAVQVERQSEASKFDFTMYLEADGDALTGNLVYNTDLFDPTTIEQLIDAFDRLAHRLVSNPDSVIQAKTGVGSIAPAVGSALPVKSDQPDTVDSGLLARMCDIWGEVIGTRVGPDDNFFELGGHSLTAIRAFSRIDAEWDFGLPISAIFESPTPRSFVREIEKLRDRTQPETSPTEENSAIDRSPLSFAQRRLWFLHMLTPEAGDYHTPWRVRLKGDLSLEALQHAIDAIIVRHPVFRTRIEEDGGLPYQVVDEPRPMPLRIIDVGPSTSDISAALQNEAFAPFDLATEHPIRVAVFRVAPDDHILSIVAHHIATDADSISIVRNDLEALYTAYLSGDSADLSDASTSYAQFATQQVRRLTPDDLDLDWWLKTLAGSTSNLDLPADRIRPPFSGGEAGVVRCELDRDVSDAMQRLSQDEGMTPFMAYLAAYALLLHRSTRQDDFVIGIPSNERNSVELEKVVGFFVNPLPIRIRIDPQTTIRRFLKQVRSTVLDALAHRHVPFDAVVEHMDSPRDPSRTPIFQTMFDLRSAPTARLSLPHLSTVPLGIPLGPHPAKYDVRAHITDMRGDVRFLLEFRKDLYDESTIDAMAEHFSALLSAVAGGPDVRIDMLQLEPTAPDSAPRSITNARLIELVDRVIGRAGPATAVVEGDTSHSYTEIGAASHEVAKRLSVVGVEPGDTVGIQMPRGAAFVTAIVGIVRSGAVYVPLDLGYPQARIDTIAEDAGLKAILSQGSSIDNPLVETRAVAGEPYSAADRMAYIMYTSGSTGSPKGVEVKEASIINLVCDTDYVQIDGDTVIGFASNTGFDAATFEVWGTLLNGATLHVLDNATLLAPETLAEEIRISGISVMFLTSALFNAVILHSPAAFSSLDTLMVGGEALDPDMVRLCLASGPPRRLLNVYGPTETTTFATWKPIVAVPIGAKSIPIGTAIAGASISVVDANLTPLPTGAPGELIVGGHGVAAGYRGNPPATAERFITLDGKRLYRTGDLVRRTSTGDIEFLGRIDRQIKLRGFRIEPGEIEAHLKSHPAIEQAHVVVRSTEHDSRLVAYIVGKVTPQVAIEHLYPLLPSFMIPTAVVVLDALPITPNGKIDEGALPAPDSTQHTSGELHGEAQIAMARLWEEALEVEGVGADSNFFDLGGHSLLAIRLMAAIEQQYGQRLPLSALFEAPTLAALTALINEPRVEPKGPVVTIKPDGSGSPIVCMPPAGGNVMTYELMSRSLNADRPIIGIEAVGLGGTSSPLNSVEALADHCRESIAAHGITGPYVLAGYSLGGLIAFEVARQLRREGEEVELVIVIDARVRPKKSHGKAPERRHMVRRGAQARNIPPLTKRLTLGVRRVGGRVLHGPKTVIARATGRPLSPRLVERLMFRAAAKAASTYQAGPYDGRMLFVMAGDPNDPAKAGVISAWRELVGSNLEVVGVPGTHRGEESLMRAPHAESVAAQIQAALTGASIDKQEAPR